MVGDVNIVMGQYNVDVRVINVESGVISATEGATFAGASYRTHMQSIAQKLAAKVAIKSGPMVQAASRPNTAVTAKTRSTVETLYGYLKIFPNELGEFQSEPTTVISQINKQAKYGYNNWRIPTNEELSLLKANNYLGNGNYMTRESRSGKVLLVTDGKDLKSQGLVDLGLPSRTLWKEENEPCGFYSYEQAVSRFGNRLPTRTHLEELKNKCQWTWTGSGYKVTGPNGNSIVLPAAGYRGCDGGVRGVGSDGYYRSSTPSGSEGAWSLGFGSGYVGVDYNSRCFGHSVRLVQDQ